MDHRSTKSGDVWRGQLQQWKKRGGINLENAEILCDYLPDCQEPAELMAQDSIETRSLQAQLDEIQRTLDDVVEEVQELRRHVVQTEPTPAADGPRG